MTFTLGDLVRGGAVAAATSSRGRQCRRKVRHATLSDAEAARQRLMAARHVPLNELRVYPCPFGHHFHIGHVQRPPKATR